MSLYVQRDCLWIELKNIASTGFCFHRCLITTIIIVWQVRNYRMTVTCYEHMQFSHVDSKLIKYSTIIFLAERRYATFCTLQIGSEIQDTELIMDVHRLTTDLSFSNVAVLWVVQRLSKFILTHDVVTQKLYHVPHQLSFICLSVFFLSVSWINWS